MKYAQEAFNNKLTKCNKESEVGAALFRKKEFEGRIYTGEYPESAEITLKNDKEY